MSNAAIPVEVLMRLCEGAAAVAGQTQLRDVLWTTVDIAVELTGARYGALGVVGEHGALTDFFHRGLEPGRAARIGSPPTGGGVLGAIARRGETIRTDHISDHPDALGVPDHHPDMDTFLGVPITAGGTVFGNLYLAEKEGGFTDDDTTVVEALAVIAGSAINTARLQQRLRRVAVVEDRERIARDIHDAIIQDLFAVGLSLQSEAQSAAAGEVASALTDAVAKLDKTITALRDFILHLRPDEGDDLELEDSVRSLIAGLAAPYDTPVRVTIDHGLGTVPPEVAEDALQVTREALSNALRHAAAQHIDVTLDRTDTALVVTVVDDGRGFDTAAVEAGMGIENIQARASRAVGKAELISAPGAGTTVRVVLPT